MVCEDWQAVHESDPTLLSWGRPISVELQKMHWRLLFRGAGPCCVRRKAGRERLWGQCSGIWFTSVPGQYFVPCLWWSVSMCLSVRGVDCPWLPMQSQQHLFFPEIRMNCPHYYSLFWWTHNRRMTLCRLRSYVKIGVTNENLTLIWSAYKVHSNWLMEMCPL